VDGLIGQHPPGAFVDAAAVEPEHLASVGKPRSNGAATARSVCRSRRPCARRVLATRPRLRRGRRGRSAAPRRNGGGRLSIRTFEGTLSHRLSKPQPADPLAEPSARERQVLEPLASALSNQEIGLRPGLAEKTIKHYMTNILTELQLRSRVEAALLATRIGLGQSSRSVQ
jgi:DNA-binding CsgD family transcriptional regulator